MIKKTTLLLMPSAVLVLVGCPPGVIDLGYNWFYPDGGTSSTTGGTGGADAGTGGGGATGGDAGTGGAPLCTPGAASPCYSGPVGTAGVGLCAAGTQTCAADGASWGPCVGEVLPQVENCATPFDEDCDGMASSCLGSLSWAKNFGDADYQETTGIAVDSTGNVIAVGGFLGSIDFGGGPFTSAGDVDPFIVKLTPSGQHLWSKSFGGAYGDAATAVATDAAGNVVVTGNFRGPVDFGGGPLGAGPADIFVVKLDPQGQHVWSRRFGGIVDAGASGVAARGVAIDAAGAVLVAGDFWGAVDLGAGVVSNAGTVEAFLMKLDESGNSVWNKHFGDPGSQSSTGAGVAMDSAGNAFVTGGFWGSATFGGDVIQSAGAADIFLAKFTPGGDVVWTKRFGDGAEQVGIGVAVDTADDVILTGSFKGTVGFGSGPVVSLGDSDIFVAKLDGLGNHKWSVRFGGPQIDLPGRLALDGMGNVLVTGQFFGAVDFGGGAVTSNGIDDAFLVKLTPGGSYVWARGLGGAQHDAGQALAVDSAGNVLLGGYMEASVDFGAGALSSAGLTDAFIAKFTP